MYSSTTVVANTLAPAPGRALVPWARSDVPGAADGGAKLDLARWIEAEIKNISQLELIAPATLSILAFAVRDEGQSLAERNSATRTLMQRINDKQRVNLTGTLLRDVYVIRIAISAFRLHQERMDMLLEDLLEALAAPV